MAKCDQKTLSGIFGMGQKLGLDHDALRAMTSTGSLRLVPQAEAERLFRELRIEVEKQTHPAGEAGLAPTRGGSATGGSGPWRLYQGSSLYREIVEYVSGIQWTEPGGFRAWLRKCFKISDLRFVSSFRQAVDIKNALKRMAHDEARCAAGPNDR